MDRKQQNIEHRVVVAHQVISTVHTLYKNPFVLVQNKTNNPSSKKEDLKNPLLCTVQHSIVAGGRKKAESTRGFQKEKKKKEKKRKYIYRITTGFM